MWQAKVIFSFSLTDHYRIKNPRRVIIWNFLLIVELWNYEPKFM